MSGEIHTRQYRFTNFCCHCTSPISEALLEASQSTDTDTKVQKKYTAECVSINQMYSHPGHPAKSCHIVRRHCMLAMLLRLINWRFFYYLLFIIICWFQNGFFSALPFLGLWAATVVFPLIADKLRSAGVLSTLAVRRVFNTIGKPRQHLTSIIVVVILEKFTVKLRRARFVLGLVTPPLAGLPSRPTQPGHPSMRRCRRYWQRFHPLFGKKRRVMRSSRLCYTRMAGILAEVG